MKHLITHAIIWVSTAIFATFASAQDEELLEPDKAFALSATADGPGRATVTWDIADGYYMYRDKYKFAVIGGGSLGEVDYPKGKIKSDEFFGDVEVYVDQAQFHLAVDGGGDVTLRLEGQGCNEPVGVCYPPIVKELVVAIPAAVAAPTPTASAPAESSGGAVAELRNLLGNIGGEDDFLPVEEAFKLDIEAVAGGDLAARFRVADGYYLYQDKIDFQVVSGPARAGPPRLPEGKEKNDEYFGLMTVYLEDFEVGVPLTRSDPAPATITVEAKYQGCAEKGICYPPVSERLEVSLPQLVSDAAAATALPSASAGDDRAGAGGKSMLGYLVTAFGVGVLLTFTPCVLPMIPILSSIIVGQGGGTRGGGVRGGTLSLVYVLGTAVTYAVIGAVAGATGEQLQAYFQNIWAIGVLALVFVLMSLSMFGLYKIQMPSFIQSRVQETSSSISGGTFGMVFVLGLMSALIVGACVSPLLISLLTIAISQGDAVLGASMMFAMSLGMGVFLVAIGFGAGAFMPRAGAWMDRVNYVFGVLLLAVAIYLLGAVPEVPVLLLWAALFIITGVYMGATQALPNGASGWRYLVKGAGTVLLVWGILALVGGLNGNRDVMNPLPLGAIGLAAAPSAAGGEHQELFIQVSDPAQLDEQLASARSAGKHVMLDFYADWCTDCIRMEKTTFVDAEVKRRFDSDFVLLQVDVTDPNDEGGKALKKRYAVYGPPAMLFFRNGGEEIRDLRLYGYRKAEEFIGILDSI